MTNAPTKVTYIGETHMEYLERKPLRVKLLFRFPIW